MNEQNHESGIVDIGALAQRLHPKPRPWEMLLWWCAFFMLVAACVYPNTATLAAAWLVVIGTLVKKQAARNAFFRNLNGLPCLSRESTALPLADSPSVAALVPARNEESSIDAAARSLATLTYPNLEVWFVNDHSTDATPQLLDAIKKELPRVHVLHDPPATEDWFGKSNALWQAFEQTGDQHEWLLFADADVIFEQGIIEQALALCSREQLDFLTCLPRLITKSWAEQLLLPNGWRDIVLGADIRRLNHPASFPVGIGAFMLVKRSTYLACGGHKALAHWHPEDALLAAAVKAAGGKVGFAWTPDLLRIRMYDSYRQIKTYTLRKVRMFYGDRLEMPLTMMAMRLSTMIMPVPMMAVGIASQVAAGRFDTLETSLAAAGLCLYAGEVREFARVDRIVTFHPIVPWLNPLSGLVRIWFSLSLIGQILAKRPMEWRGRSEFGSTWIRKKTVRDVSSS